MGTTTALSLNDKLGSGLGGFISSVTTTNIGATALVVDTKWNEYDGGQNNTFQNHWVYIASEANDGVERKVRAYYTANATAVLWGAALSADTNVADLRMAPSSYGQRQQAINSAIGELSPQVISQSIINNAIITSANRLEYFLPTAFEHGRLERVMLQRNVTNAVASQSWTIIQGWDITQIAENTDLMLRFPYAPGSARPMRLEGTTELNTMTVSTNTIPTDDDNDIALLVAYAKYKFYQVHEKPVASEDVGRYQTQEAKAFSEYQRLKNRNPVMKSGYMNLSY